MPRKSAVNARKQQRAASGKYSNSKQGTTVGKPKTKEKPRSAVSARQQARSNARGKTEATRSVGQAREAGKFTRENRVEARKTSAAAKPKPMTLGKTGRNAVKQAADRAGGAAGRLMSSGLGRAAGVIGAVGVPVIEQMVKSSQKGRKRRAKDKAHATEFSSAAKSGQGTKRAVTKGTKAEQEARSTAKAKSKTTAKPAATKKAKATSAAPNKKSRQAQSKMANSADYGGRKTTARTRKSGDKKSRSYADK